VCYNLDKINKYIKMPIYHNLKIEYCFKKVKSSADGLSEKDALKRAEKYGLNKLREEKKAGKFSILLSQFKSPLIYILVIAGGISFALEEYIDAGVIFGSVFLNTIIGFFQENKANNSLDKLKQMITHKARVLRDGHEIEIDSENLVVGDVIVLDTGSRVPADARIIEEVDLQVNEANLTGESIPSSKDKEVVEKGVPIADRSNMVYASTVVVRGSGKALVVATGENTEIGHIAKLVKGTEEEKTPLQIRLGEISRVIGILVGFFCILVVAIGVYKGIEFFEMFITGVAIAVAAIPEGLVVAVTVILVVGMQRILKEKALTRKLVAAETLGSTTVICTDKTGTLTEGNMHVSNIIIGEKEFEVGSLGSRQDEKEAKYVSLALQAGMMCNDAVVENPDDALSEWRIIGAPTEKALLSAAVQSGLRREKLGEIEPRIDELPFSSDTKYMITLHQKKKGGVIYEKGAPEVLLNKSINFYHKGKLSKLTEKEKKELIKTYESLTSKGLRVLGVAFRELNNLNWDKKDPKKDWDGIDQNLTFIGFIALKDPLRKEAKETIKICRRAGIRPVIITGDHKLTAKAIANEIGLNVHDKNIITGSVLDKTDDEKLKKLVNTIDIYAQG
jgi:Ca2+-transporting ATPase